MKKMIPFVMAALLIVPPTVKAQEVHGELTDHAGVVNVGNKICPVSNEEVGLMGKAYTVEYNGKEYNLCCKMCAKDFQKNPEKYSKIAEAETLDEKHGGVEANHQDHQH